MPRISVLLPVYNAERYVGGTVHSVLQQSFTDFELIAVDDGSTDRSLHILNSFDDQRLKVYHQKNQGLATTLNTAFRYSSGQFIARIDADDICLPERFLRQIAYLNANPSISVVGSAVQYIDDEGEYIARSFPTINVRFISKQLSRGRCCLAHPTVMMRAEALRDSGGYDELIGCGIEDSMLWAKMISRGHLIGNIPVPLVKYRLTSEAISSVSRDAEYNEIVRKMFDNVNDLPKELTTLFANKRLRMQEIGGKQTAGRISSVVNAACFKLYKYLISMKLPESLCEKVVYSIRTSLDAWR
jgi:glycosyltransferase involved in cell wall biosynthesis